MKIATISRIDSLKKDNGKVLRLILRLFFAHDSSYFEINAFLFYTEQKVKFSMISSFFVCSVKGTVMQIL